MLPKMFPGINNWLIFLLDKHICTLVVGWTGQNDLLCIMSVYMDTRDSLFNPINCEKRQHLYFTLYYIVNIHDRYTIYNIWQ